MNSLNYLNLHTLYLQRGHTTFKLDIKEMIVQNIRFTSEKLKRSLFHLELSRVILKAELSTKLCE